jgi:hypothetical protein
MEWKEMYHPRPKVGRYIEGRLTGARDYKQVLSDDFDKSIRVRRVVK